MKPETQRIAIAEACGWKRFPEICNGGMRSTFNEVATTNDIPDYLNDLNAMHEAEKVLTKEQCYRYSELVGTTLGDWKPSTLAANWPFHATAAMRAEAFLRTIGKWVDSNPENPVQ